MTVKIHGSNGVSPPTWTTATRPTVGIEVGNGGWNTTTNSFEIYVGNGNWQSVASTAYLIEYLIVAGGGSGGVSTYGGGTGAGAGGGGAGGLITGINLSVTPGTSYSIIVGAGGAAVTNAVGGYYNGNPGSNSSAFSLTAIGGGFGGGSVAGGVGGSGGGSGWANTTTAAGTLGQGNAGGPGEGNAGSYWGGSGGGAGAAGTLAGNGGIGVASSITGSSQFYSGGGAPTNVSGASRAGGSGGGGASGANGTAGGINTGGGGGAGSSGGATSGSGGSGIVIARYLGNTQRATGGIVTITGGYVIHTFNTSGTFVA